jgi:hypothetical protein
VPIQPPPIPQKIDQLLALLGKRSRPGVAAPFDPNLDGPLLDCPDTTEAEYLLGILFKRNYVERGPALPTGDSFHTLPTYVLTEGWNRLAPGPGGKPGECFIAMSFDPSLAEAYERGIYAALKTDCHLDTNRVDRKPHNERIDDKIIVGIRSAEFIVADVTGERPNLYFEAGFAMALGRPVIWTGQRGTKLHFDVR